MKKIFNKKNIIIIISIIILYPIITLFLSSIIYNKIFDNRFETQIPLNFKIEEFENLNRKQYKYKNIDNNELVGYLYFSDIYELNDYTGLVIVVHGLGAGGHSVYMECINYFVNNKLLVFSYDASGNDESEGIINGLPQQLIDLHYTINFINNNFSYLDDLPLFLFGHSWGGYAVTNILNFVNEVDAVVSISGFNSSYDIIKYYSTKYASILAYTGLAFVKMHEINKFKEYGSSEALKGFENSDSHIMIIHSEDDSTVPISIGYDLYYEKYKDNNRFKFIKYENKGHNYVFYSNEAINEINLFNSKYNEWLSKLNYNYKLKKNNKQFLNDKTNFYNLNLDRNTMCNLIDKDLFNDILNFYNQSVNK